MVQSTPDSTLENLSRLASKPGVQSTLILSKADGSIIRSTGLLAASLSESEAQGAVGNGATFNGAGDANGSKSGAAYSGSVEGNTQSHTAEDVAKMVFSFVTSAKAFAEGMDEADEVKLLRLRTRKSEIVIVPDPKFLLVVIHNTPPA